MALHRPPILSQGGCDGCNGCDGADYWTTVNGRAVRATTAPPARISACATYGPGGRLAIDTTVRAIAQPPSRTATDERPAAIAASESDRVTDTRTPSGRGALPLECVSRYATTLAPLTRSTNGASGSPGDAGGGASIKSPTCSSLAAPGWTRNARSTLPWRPSGSMAAARSTYVPGGTTALKE